ncbi:hypothetical protein BEP19_16575 [Ammoniphilus oxalaticus]|uniref:Zinc ribbon domain-containing protein n=1 Tax=Ammoniphilus oxalaticus TaxID=66863 RepID=A0A419SQS5_9BACL|nr:hypothetical protein [Ammoniphilus oxalaticus]RKD26809.1 hypothetical protein BEP19_16575 [Ammoniphilus oxalaticus]
MSFLNRVRGTFDAATRKSQDVIEINKLNHQIKKLEDEADGLYLSIGQKVYRDPSMLKQETKNHVDVQVHALERLHRQIHEAKRKALILKDLVECNACHKIVAVDIAFCPDCGNHIADLVKQTMKFLALEEQHKQSE